MTEKLLTGMLNLYTNKLTIMLSLETIEIDSVISETVEMSFFAIDIYSKIIILGHITWLYYIENHTIERCFIMRLNYN